NEDAGREHRAAVKIEPCGNEIIEIQPPETLAVAACAIGVPCCMAISPDGLPAREEKARAIGCLGHEPFILLDEIVVPAVVRVQQRDPARPRRADSKVAGCWETSLLGIRPAKHPYSRILKGLEPLEAAVRRGVVHNDDLIDGLRLSQDRTDRAR